MNRYQVTHIKKADKKQFANLIIRPLFNRVKTKNFNLFHAHLVKNAQAPMVRHRFTDELVVCLKGSFHVILNKKKFALKEGHLVWIPRGTWHMFKTRTTNAEALAIFTPNLNLKKPDVETPTARATLR